MKRLLAVAILLVAAGPASAQLEGLTNPFNRRRSAGAFPAAVVSTRPHPAVCRIIVPNSDGTSFGTGTLVDARGKHGLVLTNWHVVNEASGPIEVVFPDGFRTPGHVHKVDKDWDLAALAIYRPSTSPVTLSQQVPREGDALTIAGYGQGDYRAVTGRCLQFLAPSDNQPFEIIELGAAARQGDSGGPIFNTRGELAGVLFGEGDGRTCGSHCGRVNRFLAGVLPGTTAQSDALLAARPPAGAGMHSAAAAAIVHEEPLEPVGGSSLGGGISAVAASAVAAPPIEASAPPASIAGDPLSPSGNFIAAGSPAAAAEMTPPADNNWVLPTAASPAVSSPPPIESAPPPGAMVQTAASPPAGAAATAESRPGPAWLYSPAVEITKNVLAGVGVLAIFGHLLRAIFARKPAAA
ncbi:MAG: serine protease [Pirellulales bacterium]